MFGRPNTMLIISEYKFDENSKAIILVFSDTYVNKLFRGQESIKNYFNCTSWKKLKH